MYVNYENKEKNSLLFHIPPLLGFNPVLLVVVGIQKHSAGFYAFVLLRTFC